MSENIFYVAVLKENVIIASFSPSGQDFEKEISKNFTAANQNTNQIISSNNIYSFLSTPLLTFCCVSPQSLERNLPLSYLDSLSRRWGATIGQITTKVPPHSYDKQLSENFGEFTATFGQRDMKKAEINQKLDQTQALMSEAVSKALERGEDLDNIDSKTEELLSTSEEFRTQARNLKQTMRCKSIKEKALWACVVIVVLYLILSALCGGLDLKPNCIKENK